MKEESRRTFKSGVGDEESLLWIYPLWKGPVRGTCFLV